MTEEEWLGETMHAQYLVTELLGPGKLQRTKAGKRRLRLFACACCRLVWPLLDSPLLHQAVEAAERFAEGLIERAELQAFVSDVRQMTGENPPDGADLVFSALREPASSAAWYMTATPISLNGEPDLLSDALLRPLLREVFGNPFRPVALERGCRTRTVLALAEAAYEERHLPSGHLDRTRLAVLADALEEAGATGDILAHLRSPGPHVRGCHALDAILGKS
jgi:hypothetical protein